MSDYITLPLAYTYNGTHNGAVRLLQKQNEDGTIHLVNDYGETMARVRDGNQLVWVLNDLRFGEYE